MNGTPKEMAALARAATEMRTDNHGRYLAELMRWYRHASLSGEVDPVASLDFLVALWKTPFAGRPDELLALNDVGRWLEGRLSEEPGMSAERLAWQVGWLRRIANVDEDLRRASPRDGPRARPPEPSRGFGSRVADIRKKREQVLRAARASGGSAAPLPPSTPVALDAAALARSVDKGNAAARVPEILRSTPPDQKASVAREILKRLDRKWVEARTEKPWAAEVLAAAS